MFLIVYKGGFTVVSSAYTELDDIIPFAENNKDVKEIRDVNNVIVWTRDEERQNKESPPL